MSNFIRLPKKRYIIRKLNFGSGSSSSSGNTKPKTASFNGNGVLTSFTIADSENIQIQSVFVGGQLMREGEHYTKDNATKTVTLNFAPEVGVDVTYFAGVSVGESNGDGVTNLSYIPRVDGGTVTSDTGSDAQIPLADSQYAGLMTAAEKGKLSGIQAGATQNSSDSHLLNRANHTGTQSQNTITGLVDALNTIASALGGKENSITGGGANQYWAGDKTFKDLNKAAVGLNNVDNTSDLNKPISTDVQNALTALVGGAPSIANTLGKLYNLLTSIGTFVSDYDASSGIFPLIGAGGGAINKGDYWLITTPGTITGYGDLKVGDALFAKVNGATLPEDFFTLPFAVLSDAPQDGNTWGRNNGAWVQVSGGGGGVTDHGALSGLGDDDHPQYYNQTRGDARYSQITDTNAAILAIFNEINNLFDIMQSVGEFVGDHDASTGLPTIGTGISGTIDKGDYWLITTPGTIAGLGDLKIGDVLFAKVANALVATNFFYLPFSTLVSDASETVKGIAKLYNDLNNSNTDGAVTQAVVKSAIESIGIGTLTEPSPLFAYTFNNTRIKLFWQELQEDVTYTVERSTASNFAGAVQIYSGLNTSFEDTGLTQATTYYYRVRASRPGFTTTNWITAQATTLTYSPLLWFEARGIERNKDNEYATSLSLFGTPNIGRDVSVLKSIVGSGTASMRVPTEPGSWEVAREDSFPEFSNVPNEQGDRSVFTIDSPQSVTDFVLMFRGKIALTGLLIFANSTTFIRFANSTQVQVSFGSSINANYPSQIIAGTEYDFVFRRIGNQFSISLDGGNTFGTSVTVPATAVTYTHLWGTSDGTVESIITFKRFAFVSGTLSTPQIQEFFNYSNGIAFNPSAQNQSIVPKVIGWENKNNFINNYVNFELGSVANGTLSRMNIWSNGDYHYLLVNEQHPSPSYSRQHLFCLDGVQNRISKPLPLGYFTENEDVHNTGSIFMVDNRLLLMQQTVHYDQSTDNTFVLRRTPRDFDLRSISTREPIIKGVQSKHIFLREQYHKITNIGGTIYKLTQVYNGTAAPIASIATSIDNGNNWRKYDLYNSGNNDKWIYPNMAYNGTRNEIYIFLQMFLATAQRYNALCFLRSTDGITFTNISGSSSKNIATSGAFTEAELLANYAILDATSLTGDASFEQGFVTSNGMVYGIVGNGSDTGDQLFYGNVGGSWNFSNVNYGSENVVVTRKTSTSGLYVSAFNRALPVAVFRGSNTFDLYYVRRNSSPFSTAAWKISQRRTADNGASWSFVQDITTDNFKQHIHPRVSENFHFNSNAVLTATAVQSADTGYLFVKKI